MRNNIQIVTFVFVAVFLLYGCNIVPKSVQYQKEEEDLLGSIDIVNPVVEEIQVVLERLGYEGVKIDGKMGQATREVIKEFQEARGLKPTGYIDDRTLREIEDIRREYEKSKLEDMYKIEVRSPYLEDKDVSRSVVKVTLKEIQTALKNAGFDPGAVDGKMGPRTQQAIKEFQRAKGLKIDGKVGPETWGELKGYLRDDLTLTK